MIQDISLPRSEYKPRPIFIIGPTASGKSALALTIAQRLNGQIVGCDAMQLYQGMDIGTAKTPIHLRQGVPHHLIDIWTIDQLASVANYQIRAQGCVNSLLEQGVTPIIVGGSMLYVQSLIDNWSFPKVNPVMRIELEDEYQKYGLQPLRQRLAELDPISWKKILPTDIRRTIRALEVILSTGEKYNPHMPNYDCIPAWNSIIYGIDRSTVELDEHIEIRTTKMFDEGLVAEVTGLMDKGIATSPTASKAIGYAQIIAALEGEYSLEKAYERIIQLTKRYVRRQCSWFRRDQRIYWLDGILGLEELAELITNQLRM